MFLKRRMMVGITSYTKQHNRPIGALYKSLLALTCVVTFLYTRTTSQVWKSVYINNTLFPLFDADSNARKVKHLRQSIGNECDAAISGAKPERPSNDPQFIVPSGNEIPIAHDKKDAIHRCKNVVLDFGANIGDTAGHVIDSGLISCHKRLHQHFNVNTMKFEYVKKLNPLTQHLHNLMTKLASTQGPEDYCYYGVEGNHHFTQRLQKLENYVMSMSPRPLQHMHFFTESVGAGEDGMTKLYLDTINEKENFWGSSIYKDHRDVRKSVGTRNVETIAAPVVGYTLGTLMRMTLKAFDPNASDQDKKGGHLIMKIDIEGGEYPLMNQAISEGTLCEFVGFGNSADTFIEFHGVDVTGEHKYVGKTKDMIEALKHCNVTVGDLEMAWF